MFSLTAFFNDFVCEYTRYNDCCNVSNSSGLNDVAYFNILRTSLVNLLISTE